MILEIIGTATCLFMIQKKKKMQEWFDELHYKIIDCCNVLTDISCHFTPSHNSAVKTINSAIKTDFTLAILTLAPQNVHIVFYKIKLSTKNTGKLAFWEMDGVFF